MINFNDIKLLANHLNIKAAKIKCEEWSTVLFVSGRFVSKKVIFKNGDKRIFKRFIKSHVSNWNLFDLKILNKNQLQVLSLLLGIAKSGSKRKIIERIVNTVYVRLIVTPFAKLAGRDKDKIETFKNNFKHKELRQYCRTVKTFAPSNKYGMAASLISWLRSSVRRGQKAYHQLVSSFNFTSSEAA